MRLWEHCAISTVLDAPELAAVEHDRTAFNLAVWYKLVADPELATLNYRIETDKHGQIIMSPPPSPDHGSRQSSISMYLKQQLSAGRSISECPISTRKGVKAADVAWCSPKFGRSRRINPAFYDLRRFARKFYRPRTPRVRSRKKSLHFDAGAADIWVCEQDGTMRFFSGTQELAKIPELP